MPATCSRLAPAARTRTERHLVPSADWESASIAWVAQKNGIRVLILRVVTDLVGDKGGEAYGNIGLFHDRTKTEMKKLFEMFPAWLEQIEF